MFLVPVMLRPEGTMVMQTSARSSSRLENAMRRSITAFRRLETLEDGLARAQAGRRAIAQRIERGDVTDAVVDASVQAEAIVRASRSRLAQGYGELNEANAELARAFFDAVGIDLRGEHPEGELAAALAALRTSS
jgi:hypothetical protein